MTGIRRMRWKGDNAVDVADLLPNHNFHHKEGVLIIHQQGSEVRIAKGGWFTVDDAGQADRSGFIQLVRKADGNVLAQATGTPHQLPYFAQNVWHVSQDVTVQFVEHSELAHPWKFFRALPNETMICVFINNYGDKMPMDALPIWSGPASKFEVLDEQWDAYVQESGEWVGTSEY